MNNNLETYFNAAKEQPVLLNANDVRSIISTKSATAKFGFRKWFYLSAVFIPAVALWLAWQPKQADSKQTTTLESKNDVAEIVIEQPATEEIQTATKNISATPQKREAISITEQPEKSERAEEMYENNFYSAAPHTPLYSSTHTAEISDNNYFNEQGYLVLNYEELEDLGIITNGNTLNYYNRTDNIMTVRWGDEQKRKTPIFEVEVGKLGSSITRQHFEDDSVKALETKPFYPAAFEIWSKNEKRANNNITVVGIARGYGYDIDYFNEMKPSLVPVYVELKAKLGILSSDRFVIFWFKNEPQFIRALPNDVASAVTHKFGQPKDTSYFAEVQRKYHSLAQKEHLKGLDSSTILSLQKKYISIDENLLKKLNIQRDKEWIKTIYYQLDSNNARTKGFYRKYNFKGSDMYIYFTTSGIFHASKKKAANQPALIAISNYSLQNINFVQTDFEIANSVQEKKQYEYFKQISNELYPIVIDSNHVFWYRKNEKTYQIIQQDKYSKAGVDLRKVNKLSLTPDELKKLGITYESEGIRIPTYATSTTTIYSVYNNAGSTHQLSNFKLKNDTSNFPTGEKTPPIFEPKSSDILAGNKSISPVLITNLDGIGWRSYAIEPEISQAMLDSMIKNNISPQKFQPYIYANEKAKAQLILEMKMLVAIELIHPTLKKTGIIAWYRFDSALLNVLPPQAAAEMQREAEALRNHQQPVQCNYFEACNELNVSFTAQAFPNPTTDILNIEIETPQENDFSVCLTDISGKVIKQLEQNKIFVKAKHKLSYDISSLAAGMYLLQISNGKQELITRRVIKK